MYIYVQLTVQMRKRLHKSTSENWIKDVLSGPRSAISSSKGKESQVTDKCYICLRGYLLVQGEAEGSSMVI